VKNCGGDDRAPPTKPDNPRQLTFRPLSVEQLTAIDVLVMGKTDAEAAQAAGVTRPTVTDWRNHHPVFKAMLNERRSALWAEAHDRLRALVGKAIENLEHAVHEGKLPVSIEVLKIVGLYGAVGAPSGPTSPDVIIRETAEAQATREGLLPHNLHDLLPRLEGNPARARRVEALTAELRVPYLEHGHES
jgi:hypothetical protein